LSPSKERVWDCPPFPRVQDCYAFPIVQGGFSAQFCICTFVFKEREMDNQQQEFGLQEERNKLLL
jgi:hypothetical protein